MIRRFEHADLDAVVALTLRAWEPVFASFETVLGPAVYALLFPDWRAAETAAITTTCTNPEHDVWVAVDDDRVLGFVAVGFVDEDAARAGEIHMIAVDPDHQRGGVGTSLMERAIAHVEELGLALAVVSTGGDPGHDGARALYERLGFTPMPLVRYYRAL